MAYSYPGNFNNGTESIAVTGLGSLIQYGDSLIGGMFAEGVLGFIFVFTFILSMMVGSNKAILVSSFITWVFSIYFMRLQMVSQTLVYLLMIMVLLGIAFVWGERSSGGM